MPDGVIVGGWNFVIAAYVVVGGSLALYGLILWRRARRAREDAARTARTEAPESRAH